MQVDLGPNFIEALGRSYSIKNGCYLLFFALVELGTKFAGESEWHHLPSVQCFVPKVLRNRPQGKINKSS